MGKYLRWQELRTLNEVKGLESLNKSNKSNHTIQHPVIWTVLLS